jgi:glucose uptake protein
MILPATTLASLLLLFLTLICWGSWANSQRLVYKWRFELFFYDFAIGVALCVLIAAYTFGSWNTQDLSFTDNFLIASYRKIAYAVAAGAIVGLANMLLGAAISVSGMTVAFPLSFGVALVITSSLNYIGNPQSANAPLLFGGNVLVLAAIVIDIMAYRSHMDALALASKAGPTLDPRTRLPVRAPIAARGILLSVFSGVVLGFFFPVIDASRYGDNGVSSYGVALMVGFGIFFTTILYVPFFVNFPVMGAPAQVRDYFKGARKQHFWGIFAGILWSVGLLAALIEGSVPLSIQANPAVATALIFGAPVLASLWGIFAWSEFKGTTQGVKSLLLGMVVVFMAGLALVALAPMFATK